MELAKLEATEDLLEEMELLLGTELLVTVALEELLSELLTELVVPQAATTPKGAGWLVQVEREIQLLLFS